MTHRDSMVSGRALCNADVPKQRCSNPAAHWDQVAAQVEQMFRCSRCSRCSNPAAHWSEVAAQLSVCSCNPDPAQPLLVTAGFLPCLFHLLPRPQCSSGCSSCWSSCLSCSPCCSSCCSRQRWWGEEWCWWWSRKRTLKGWQSRIGRGSQLQVLLMDIPTTGRRTQTATCTSVCSTFLQVRVTSQTNSVLGLFSREIVQSIQKQFNCGKTYVSWDLPQRLSVYQSRAFLVPLHSF